MDRKIIGFFLIVIGFVMMTGSSPVITGNIVLEDVAGLGAVRLLGILAFIGGVLLMAVERSETGLLEKELEKPSPGKGIKGEYIPLREVIEKKHLLSNKVRVDLEGNKVYRDGREVQGLTLNGDYVEFKGVHFTNPEAARIIQESESLEIKNYHDPYIYLLESISYSGKDEKSIRHMIGASSAREAIIVNVVYPIDKIYLKFERGRPTHYAVDGDIEREDLISKKGTRVIRKRLEGL